MPGRAPWRVGERVVHVGQRRIRLAVVDDAEALVDRAALLRDDGAEPPYWAHLWSGAVELARHVDTFVSCAGRRVLDLGCGLGLVGIVASLKGGEVTFLDRDPAALELARLSADRNGCTRVRVRQCNFTSAELGERYDVILGAEVLYDVAAWNGLARFLATHLAAASTAIVADAHRAPTQGFYAALEAVGCEYGLERVVIREDGLPVDLDIATITVPPNAARRSGAAGV